MKTTEMRASDTLDRRSFLKGAAGAGAGLAATGAYTACTADAALADPAEDAATATPSFMIAPEPITDDQIAETVDAEVVVVGAGTSGFVTACAAAEAGAKVVLISASTSTVCRGGSNNAVYSKAMEERDIERFDVNWFYRKEMLCNGNSIDHRKWYKHYNNSEEYMNWAIDKVERAGGKCVIEMTTVGYEEKDPMWLPPQSHAFVNDEITSAGVGQSIYMDALESEFLAAGGQVFYENVAKQLVRGGVANGTEGRVEAVIAQNAAGEYVKYTGSKAVVMATGDFSKNLEMMQAYCPWAMPLLSDTDAMDYNIGLVNGSLFHGDGHQMELWVGAGWQKNVPNAAMIGGLGVPTFCNQPLRGNSGLVVNNRGQRFSNEDVIGALANRNALTQPGGEVFSIWGTNYAEDGGPWYKNGNLYGEEVPLTTEETIAGWDSWLAYGWVKCDTVEEVVEQLGLPLEETLATVNRYNELCEKGEDEDFHKLAKYMVGITEPPFYGAKNAIRFLTVLGGCNTDENMRVLTADDEVIPGLYNVGTMIGDFFANTYTFMMEGMNYGGCCGTLSYLTGKFIAENE